MARSISVRIGTGIVTGGGGGGGGVTGNASLAVNDALGLSDGVVRDNIAAQTSDRFGITDTATSALSAGGGGGAFSGRIITVSDPQPNGSLSTPNTAVASAVRTAMASADLLLMAGDLAYNGVTAEYNLFNGSTMYGPVVSAGKFRPSTGNHDYYTANATPYDTFLTNAGVTHEQAGGGPPYYYAFDYGPWRIYSLDIQNQQGYTATFAAGSAQYNWLQADLAANPGRPIIAYWHHTIWDAGAYGNDSAVLPIWQLLWDAGCDIVITGHEHGYQRFTRLSRNGSGGYPTADATGMRLFIPATGGYGLRDIASTIPTYDPNGTVVTYNDELLTGGDSPATIPSWCGYLQLDLTDTTYSWTFKSHNGTTKDSGGPVTIRNSGGGALAGPVGQTASAWTRTFTEEFTGSSLDTTRWDTIFSTGGTFIPGGGEQQWYDPAGVTVSNGTCKLTATRLTNGSQTYRSGLIQCRKSFQQQYGYFEARLKLPIASGTWPAYWMVPWQNDVWPPEIDIMETYGGAYNGTAFEATYHYDIGSGAQQVASVINLDVGNWHVYGCKWTATSLTIYIDGVQKWTTTTGVSNAQRTMYPILNLAVGTGSDNLPNSADYPQVMEIDYVRMWA